MQQHADTQFPTEISTVYSLIRLQDMHIKVWFRNETMVQLVNHTHLPVVLLIGPWESLDYTQDNWPSLNRTGLEVYWKYTGSSYLVLPTGVPGDTELQSYSYRTGW